MKVNLFKTAVAAVLLVAGTHANAQTGTETMYVYRGGSVIYTKAVAEIDSITFRTPPTASNNNFTETGGGLRFDMIAVAGGSTKPEGVSVTNDFAIGKYEVTQKLWWDVMGSWPGTAPSSTYGVGDNYPMYYVSWDDVQTFLVALNRKTGKNYRLPTESEWEYAARGGEKTHNYAYSGSATIGDVAWYSSNSGNKSHPVGTKLPNELGIYDMSGNVWEWCQDWHIEGSDRVYRGGGRDGYAMYCHVSYRSDGTPGGRLSSGAPGYRGSFLGFRLVLPL